MRRLLCSIVLLFTLPCLPSFAASIPKDSKVYIQPMDGFEVALTAAIMKKKTPVLVVDSPDKADYIISGTSRVDKAGWAKMLMYNAKADAHASIMMKSAKDGIVVFAYNVDKSSSARGEQSTAEACAKHLKEEIEKK